MVFLYKNLQNKIDCSKIINTSIEFFILIIKTGLENKNKYNLPCLSYIFPSNITVESAEDIYIGAAHGILGNMFVLIETIRLIKEVQTLNSISEKNTKCHKCKTKRLLSK